MAHLEKQNKWEYMTYLKFSMMRFEPSITSVLNTMFDNHSTENLKLMRGELIMDIKYT